MQAMVKFIDTLVDYWGKLCSLLILPMVVVVLYEVVMRYLFNAPTIWAFEATTFLYGMHFIMGYSFMELAQGHVKVDVVIARLPDKMRTMINILTHLCFSLPVLGLLIWFGYDYVAMSVGQGELNSTSWAPPIWPIKIWMLCGLGLLWLQNFSNLLKFVLELRQEATQS